MNIGIQFQYKHCEVKKIRLEKDMYILKLILTADTTHKGTHRKKMPKGHSLSGLQSLFVG